MARPRGAGGLLQDIGKSQREAMQTEKVNRKDRRTAQHESCATEPAVPGSEGPAPAPGKTLRQSRRRERARAGSRCTGPGWPYKKLASRLRTDSSSYAIIRGEGLHSIPPQMSVASTL